MTAGTREGGADALLERDAELADLAGAVARAAVGDGGILLIEGPAGIGKTRLMAEARRRGAEAGMRVLSARGSEIEREFPFGVVRQLVEGPLRDPAVAEAAYAGAAEGARPVFGSADVEEMEGSACFAALHGLFWLVVNLAGEGPLMLAVDDLHWCDRSSLRFVAYLAGRLEGLPVLVVAGLRTAEPGTDPALVAEITRDPTTVVLRPAPLSAEATTALIESRLGARAESGFSSACHRATRGNPLLLTELLRALRAEGVALDARHADAVAGVGSRAVARAVLARLSRLSADAVAVTRALAVLGDGADLRTVAELAGIDPAAAAAATGELARAEILEPETPLAFVHPLVRDAVYRDTPPGERERRHERAAALLRASGAPDERLAAHMLLMPRTGDDEVVDTLLRAARTATGRGAPDSAVTYLRRALEEPPAPGRRADVLWELGRVEVLISGPDAAEHLRAALDGLEDPARRALCAYELARTLLFTGFSGAAHDVVRRTAAGLPGELGDHRRRLQAMQRMTLFFGAEATEEPISLEPWRAPEVDDAGARLLMAMAALQWAISGGRADDCTRVALAALEGDALPDVDDNLIFVAAAIIPTLADRPESLEVWDGLLARVHRKGSLIGVLTVHLWRGYALLRRGELEEAEASVRQAREEMIAWGSPPALLAYPAAVLAEVLVERGDLAGARREVGVLGPPARADAARLLLGSRLLVLLAEGSDAELVELAGEYRHRFPDVVNPAWAPWRVAAAEALARLGRDAEAEEMIAPEIAQCRVWGAPGPLGRALRVLGALRRADGLSVLEEAVAVLDGTPARLELAKALVQLGTALRLARRPTDAREPLARGLALATACGATPVAERARAELQASGVRPRAEALTGAGALTVSERRVADLATEGRTNKDIAQVLFVTPKTIEVHLSSVYRKLGIRSRRELQGALSAA